MAERRNVVNFKEQAYDVATQAPSLTDESLADARRLRGVDYRGARATIEITPDNIRDYCNWMGSENPLSLDAAYAAQTRWGGLIAPPCMVGQAIIAPGLRGIQWIYGGIDWEFFDVFRPGDVISQQGHLEDAIEKRGKTVPRMVIQIGRLHCTTHHGHQAGHHAGHHGAGPRLRVRRRWPAPASTTSGRLAAKPREVWTTV